MIAGAVRSSRTLIAMGVGVAYLYNVVAVLVPEIFPPAFRTGGGAVAVYSKLRR